MKKKKLKPRSPAASSLKRITPPRPQGTGRRYQDLAGLVIILLLGILIYSNSFRCAFQFDDERNILDNVKTWKLQDAKAWWDLSPNRPLAYFTFALNYHFSQLDVWGYHLVNLVIHLLNACLVWWLTRLIFRTPRVRELNVEKHKRAVAFFTALLFVSHPLATQSVTYIVQRMASLAALFYLLSLALYALARLVKSRKIYAYLLYAGCVLSAVLAFLTKENAFTLPAAILLFELFFIRSGKLLPKFRDYRLLLFFVGITALIIVLAPRFPFSLFRPVAPSPWYAYPMTAGLYFLTQFSVVAKYVQLLLLPVSQNVDYQFPVSHSFFEPLTLLCFLLLLSLLALAVFLFRKNRIISFGIFWFFLTLSIESSLIPLRDVIFEHRTYLPSYGFILALVTALFTIPGVRKRHAAVLFLLVLAGAYAFLTFQRNKVWKDKLTLWSDVAKKSPDLTRPNYNLGNALFETGRLDEAIACYSKAIGINPNCDDAYYNRGISYRNLDRFDKAIADYSMAVRINPRHAKAFYNRGNAYKKTGELDKAIADYSAAVKVNPKYADAWFNRGNTYGNLQKWPEAIADYNRVTRIDPGYVNAYYNLGLAFSNIRDWDKAADGYSRVIVLQPGHAQAYYYRGIAFFNLGETDKAIADFSRAIGLRPDYAEAIARRDAAMTRLQSRGRKGG